MNVQKLNETFLNAVFQPKEKIIPLIDLCIELGVDVNCCDAAGLTALMKAAANCQTEIVKHLIDKGCDVRTKGPDGMTALIYAVKYGQLASVRLLLEKGSDSNECDVHGTTPLMFAVINNLCDIVTLLIENGCDLDCADKSGNSALSYANRNRNDTIVDILLEAGVVCQCSQCEVARRSLVSEACSSANVEKFKKYMDAGFDVTYNNYDALTLATKAGCYEIVELMVRNNLAAIRANDYEAPVIATVLGHLSILKLFVSKTPECIKARDYQGFIRAANNDQLKIVKFLVEQDPKCVQAQDFAAIKHAATHGYKSIVNYLLTKGADVSLLTEAQKAKCNIPASVALVAPAKTDAVVTCYLPVTLDALLEKINEATQIADNIIIAQDIIFSGTFVDKKPTVGTLKIRGGTEVSGFFDGPDKFVIELSKI